MAAITYNQAIPQATDQISQSQPLILQNFQGINQLIAIDHATFSSVNAGFHNQVTMPAQGSPATFTGTNAGMYSQVNSTSTLNEIYVHQSGFANDVPMTFFSGDGLGNGYFYLPNGLLVQLGSAATLATGNTVVYPIAYLSGTQPYLIASPISTGSASMLVVNVIVDTTNATTKATQFKAYGWNNSVLGNVGFKYMAIGTPATIPS